MPPILRLDIPEHRGEVDVKTAYVPGIDGFAIKISPGFFDNPKLGLPSRQRHDGSACQPHRAGRGAAARQWLPDRRAHGRGRCRRGEAPVASGFECGGNLRRWRAGGLQLEALDARPADQEARIWARDRVKARNAATRMPDQLGILVSAEPDPAKAVAGADIIVTTTPHRSR